MNPIKLKIKLNDIRKHIRDLQIQKDISIDLIKSSKEYLNIGKRLDELKNKRDQLLHNYDKSIDEKIKKQSLKAIQIAEKMSLKMKEIKND